MIFRIGCIALVLALLGVRAFFDISVILGVVSIIGVLVLFLLLARIGDLMIRLPEWISRLIEPGENNRRWRELCRTARANSLQREAYRRTFWDAWTPVEVAGRNAYCRGDHGEANNHFLSLRKMADEFRLGNFGMPVKLGSLPKDVSKSHCWWQGSILRESTLDWNEWRRKNPNVLPDLRDQFLGELRLQGADLSEADLGGASLSGSDLTGAVLANANLEQSGLYGADLSGTIGLTADQLNSALGNRQTRLPVGIETPEAWKTELEDEE